MMLLHIRPLINLFDIVISDALTQKGGDIIRLYCKNGSTDDLIEFSNTGEGFKNARAWVLNLTAENGKKQIVSGLEPTGHYWFALATWMI